MSEPRETECRASLAPAVRFGPFELDARAGELRKFGTRIRLQEQPFRLLLMLLEHPGEIVLREEIRRKLWPGGTNVEFDPGINAAVQRLRDSLGDSAGRPRFVETVARRGYRFIAEVTRETVTTERLEPPSGSEHVDVPAAVPAGSDPGAASGARPRSAWGIRLGVMACLLPLAVLLSQRLNRQPVIDSLAVLPFTNPGPDTGVEFLADGITETLTEALAKVPNLKVASWTSSSRFKGSDPRRVGDALGVPVVILGEIRQQGSSLSVSVELVETRHDRHIWGSHYTRPLAELLVLETEISGDIAERLRQHLSAEDKGMLKRRQPTDIESYQYYLKGRYHSYRGNWDGLRSASDEFARALARDPTYALAYAGLADMYWKAFDWQLSPQDAYTRGMAAARKAIELDPTLGAPHVAEAFFRTSFERDYPAAEKELLRAIALDPQYAQAWELLSWNYLPERRFDEARAAILRARQLDPLDPEINTLIGLPDYFSRRYSRAVEEFRKVTELDRNYWWAYIWLAHALERNGQPREALAAFEKAHELDDNGESAAALAWAYAGSGQRRRAEKLLTELEERSGHQYISTYYRAAATARMGDRDRALKLFEEAVREHTYMAMFLDLDPMIDPLRSDERFKNLLNGRLNDARQ